MGWCYAWIICVDGRAMYLYIVLGRYLGILGAPSVQYCCTLSISASAVGPEFVLTSPTFMRSRASHPAGLHGRIAPK